MTRSSDAFSTTVTATATAKGSNVIIDISISFTGIDTGTGVGAPSLLRLGGPGFDHSAFERLRDGVRRSKSDHSTMPVRFGIEYLWMVSSRYTYTD